MKNFLLLVLQSRTQNRQLVFLPEIPFNLVAERSEATYQNLTYEKWWTILKLVRTYFAATGGEKGVA